MARRLVLALILALAPFGASAQNASPTTAAPPAVTAADRVLGRADAPVTVIEYASFVCSHCADWHRSVYPEFKRRFVDTGQVRLVFRDLPTEPIPVAARAAKIARCAAPERFYDVASTLMTGQAALQRGAPVGAWYADAVAQSGRTQAQIDACVADPGSLETLRGFIVGADAAGVDETPTFFIDGRRVADTSLAGLSAAIQPRLARN